MAIQRLVHNEEIEDDADTKVEQQLRPQNFDQYIGQERLKKTLQVSIEAAKTRGEPVDHVLLHGPPGLGKTTMAHVIANEMGAHIRATSGVAIERAGDLASILTNLQPNDVLFIDEIHRLPKQVTEVLYGAMEDFNLDIVVGKGTVAKNLRLELPKFTLIGATTRTGALASPFRDRFGIVHRLEFYSKDEIEKVIQRTAKIMNLKVDSDASDMLAGRSRLTPRIANRLLRRTRDYATVNGDGKITKKLVEKVFEHLQIDDKGLDITDREMLNIIIKNYSGGPVGVETIGAILSEDRNTIEDYYEPFLLQIGFLERTSRGRKTTKAALDHLGYNEKRVK